MDSGLLVGIISLGIGIVLYPQFIKFLKQNKLQQTPSEYALEEYKTKPQTVTFGGVIFVFVPVILALIFGGNTVEMWLIAFVYVAYAVIGLVDDYKIVKDGKNDGISPTQKLLFQFLLALVFYILYLNLGGDNILSIPILNINLDLSYFYFLFILLFFAGFSNAVNLTDGMDGLAAGTSVIALLPLIYIAHIQNKVGVGILLYAVLGGLLSFLVYNHKPAKIFMGDVGSLALGALFASASVIMRMEILMLIIGAVFVYETACVVIQQISWRTRHKKVFKYTPIHYSYTLSGWNETHVVYFFYGLGLIFMIVGFIIGYSA